MVDYLDVGDALHKSSLFMDSSEAQRVDSQLLLAREFAMRGGECFHIETGLPIDAPAVRQFFMERRPHLFPAAVRTDLADLAWGQCNLRARALIVKEIGADEAERMARRWGLKGLGDTRRGTRPDGLKDDEISAPGSSKDSVPNNPFSIAGWSIRRQGELVRTLGAERTAAIARSVGGYLGMTKPVQ